MRSVNYHGKPYYSVDAYCKNTYGEKLYKIAINAGLSCPNRDGTLGIGGCIFCSAGGSGDFAVSRSDFPTIREQLAAGRKLFHRKNIGSRFIAYFQAYTNTYGPAQELYRLFSEALSETDIAGISIATRPDCLPSEIIKLLQQLRTEFPDKFIWLELGLQTIHEQTAEYLRRGYPLKVYDNAVRSLQAAGFPVITHLIIGLPGETEEMLFQTIQHMNRIGTWGVKLQLLHILRGTALGDQYIAEQISSAASCFPVLPLTQDEYLHLLTGCISRLSPSIVIHRLTGDAPRDLLLAPSFSLNKRNVLNSLHRKLRQEQIYQGCLYRSDTDCHDESRSGKDSS